jgi:acyl-CoA thioesterase YciA
MTEKRGELVLRVVPRMTEINSNGHIFGGWILSQMKFISPMLLGDIVTVYAHEERRGRTSLGIRVDVVATRGPDQQQIDLTSGIFTFVALDDEHKPRALPTR